VSSPEIVDRNMTKAERDSSAILSGKLRTAVSGLDARFNIAIPLRALLYVMSRRVSEFKEG